MVKKQKKPKKYAFAKQAIAFIKSAGKAGVTRKQILVHIGLDKQKGYTDFDTWFNRDGAEQWIGKRGSGMGSTYAYYRAGKNMPEPAEKVARPRLTEKKPAKPKKVVMTTVELDEAIAAAKTAGREELFSEMAEDANVVQRRVNELEAQVARLEAFKPRALTYDFLVKSLAEHLAPQLVTPLVEQLRDPVTDILTGRITAAVATPTAAEEVGKPTTIAEAVTHEETAHIQRQTTEAAAATSTATMRSPFTVALIGFSQTEVAALEGSPKYKHGIDHGLIRLKHVELHEQGEKVKDVSYVLVNIGHGSPHRSIPKPVRDQITSKELLGGSTADSMTSARRQLGEMWDQHPLRSMATATA